VQKRQFQERRLYVERDRFARVLRWKRTICHFL